MPESYPPLRIAAFASGRGSNLLAILENINKGNVNGRIVAVISNKSTAGALQLAREREIPAYHISRLHFETDEAFAKKIGSVLEQHQTELIVLAGYMKKVPAEIVRSFKNRILNIHPALLPSFGGKGLYGHFVHEAVLEYGCKVSGATVHLVDEEYDTGPPVVQQSVPVLEGDTPESLAARVLEVEHQIYSQAIQLFAERRVRLKGRKLSILPPGQK